MTLSRNNRMILSAPIWIPIALVLWRGPAYHFAEEMLFPVVTEQRLKRKTKKPKMERNRLHLEASQTRISMQTDSPFFQKLPQELRDMVYEYIARHEVHLMLVDGKLRSFSILRPLPPDNVFLNQNEYAGAGSSGVLRTCHRMYLEASDTAYSTPLFRFQDFNSFFAFSATILPERFNMIQRLQIGGFDYRLAKRDEHRLPKDEFMKGSLDYRPLRHLAYRNPILPDGPPTKRGPCTSSQEKAKSIVRQYAGIPDGPTMTRESSAFPAACFIIAQMAGLQELDMALDHWTKAARMRRIRTAQYEMHECVIPQLEKLSELKLRKFNVTFTKKTLETMGWTRQPFENGIRQ